MVTPDAKRAAVARLCETHEVSQRRACAALAVDRSSVRYVSRRADDAELRTRIRDIASERRRFAIAAYMSCCSARACR
jgi:putative transposase